MDGQQASAVSGDCCASCRFWKRNEKLTSRGICRFNPPRAGFIPGRASGGLTAGPDSTVTIWPDTFETDWCGKFLKKPIEFGFIPDCGGDYCELVTGENKTGKCAHLQTCLAEYEKQETDDDVKQSSGIIRDILLLVDVNVPVETIMTWTCEQRDLAEDWAAAVHLEASDNDIEVPPKPEFITQSEIPLCSCGQPDCLGNCGPRY